MSRSGYDDDCDDPLALGRWRAQVRSAIRGKRGQAFLRELAAELDAMPVKELIANELINNEGQCCTIGVVCKARGVDVSKIDYESWEDVGAAVNIAGPLAAEIEYENDEIGERWVRVEVPKPPDQQWHPGFQHRRVEETPAERWQRMRKWVDKHLLAAPTPGREGT
jgi:hypothetical protein